MAMICGNCKNGKESSYVNSIRCNLCSGMLIDKNHSGCIDWEMNIGAMAICEICELGPCDLSQTKPCSLYFEHLGYDPKTAGEMAEEYANKSEN